MVIQVQKQPRQQDANSPETAVSSEAWKGGSGGVGVRAEAKGPKVLKVRPRHLKSTLEARGWPRGPPSPLLS